MNVENGKRREAVMSVSGTKAENLQAVGEEERDTKKEHQLCALHYTLTLPPCGPYFDFPHERADCTPVKDFLKHQTIPLASA